MEDKIRKNAELVVEQMRKVSGIDFGYDTASVAWLDGFIERHRVRDDVDQQLIDGLVDVFGSYLGECVIRCFGGYWDNQDGHWRVSLNDAIAVYPFAKVRKQFENGSEDSIRGFFEVIRVLFNKYIGEKQT